MSCTCGSDEISKKKLQILQKKYDELRRNHRKLVGVTVELTEALEGFASGKRPDVNNTLSKCSEIYPNLFEKNSEEENKKKIENDIEVEEPAKVDEENEEKKKENGVDETPEQVPDSEKEYFEGFWSRPRILRTPQ